MVLLHAGLRAQLVRKKVEDQVEEEEQSMERQHAGQLQMQLGLVHLAVGVAMQQSQQHFVHLALVVAVRLMQMHPGQMEIMVVNH